VGPGREMDYHYRFLADGRCEILCTRCFSTIGEATTPGLARVQADLHLCPLAPGPGITMRPSTEGQKEAVRAQFLTHGLPGIPAPVLLVLAISVCYLLPTVLEWTILHYSSGWTGAVLIGDLCGCVGIFVLLRRKRLAVVLYVALTAVEYWLCAAQVVSTQMLLGLMDLVPTAILAGAIVRPRGLMLAKR